jgi:hypothetical protein
LSGRNGHFRYAELDRIAEYFGDLRIAQFDRPEKIRPRKGTLRHNMRE